ncbi:NAD(P)-binding Rossmann-fold containing protein-7 [Coleophoma crateriformis]|uniref:NAD(P)-binding Rossmann-fold containing protein-7 n=1 Tax=Coleophoma crateriformis TaxID=565419 RepID=A0A3D8SM89_9HELO|nr:NAD(P)-binding Rossmann-fold containing protein-7 [Coleophoma crateriformis]
MPSYVIVGASRGLGYEWLRQLSKDSSNTVIGLVRSVDQVQARLDADSISNVRILAGDMADSASLEKAALEVSNITQSIDYLIVNGAYISPKSARLNPSEFTGRAAELREEMVDSLEVNVVGVIYSVNAFLPLVRKGTVKKITVISSGMADTDMVVQHDIPGSIVYSSIKAATNMVVAKYAVELRGEGIVVLALSPGIVNTQEGLISEEEMKVLMVLIQKFQVFYPDFKGPITAAESVAAQKNVIEGITLEQTGSFLSHKGNKEWL